MGINEQHGPKESDGGNSMTREEFEKDNGFRAVSSCLVCGWINHIMPEEPYKPVIWYCRLMQMRGLSRTEAVIDKPENYHCEEYEG
jgi:hypothetical protein